MLNAVDATKVYLPLAPDQPAGDFVIRTEHHPAAAMSSVGQEVEGVDPSLIAYADTLENAITSNPAFVFSRIGAIFTTCVGLLGLALASIGIYGMVNFAVVQRTHEIGVRMALGAHLHDVVRLIVSQSMRPVIVGAAFGLIAAAATGQLLRSFLFGISSLDPIAFAGVLLFLAFVATLASYLPARHAAQVDPMLALRYE